MAIASAIQLFAQGVARKPLTFFHDQRMPVQIAVRTDTLHQSIYRNDQHASLHGRQLIQRRETRRDNLLMGRKTVIGQRFPVGQVHHHLVGKLTNFIMQAQSILHVRRDQHHWTGVMFGDFGDQRCAGGTGKLTQLALIASFRWERVTMLFRHSVVRFSFRYTSDKQCSLLSVIVSHKQIDSPPDGGKKRVGVSAKRPIMKAGKRAGRPLFFVKFYAPTGQTRCTAAGRRMDTPAAGPALHMQARRHD